MGQRAPNEQGVLEENRADIEEALVFMYTCCLDL